MISIIVAVTVFAVVVATIVLFARDRGPTPAEIAIAYELAWDRLDFEALWAMSGEELHDGLDRHEYLAAKSEAYANQPDLGHLIAGVDVDEVNEGIGHALVRTRITTHAGDTLHNDVLLTRRSSAWVVTGYELASGRSKTA